MNKQLNNPYLTLVGNTHKYDAKAFKDLTYTSVPVNMGDFGKSDAFIETKTLDAYNSAKSELEALGATVGLNSAGRNRAAQAYARVEKFVAVLKKEKSIKKAITDCKNLTARVSYSEHLTGLAIDLKIDCANFNVPEKIKQMYPDADEKTLNFITRRLIMEKNGFILRYPTDDRTKDVTGFNFESWHWRYIGPEHSQRMAKIREKVSAELGKNKEILLEDYIELLSHNIQANNENELIEKYCDMFKRNILKLDNQLQV